MMLDFKTLHMPTHEIDSTIQWLETIRNDCDLRIRELKNLKAGRKRATRHRENINALALQMYNEGTEFLEISDYETRIQIIQQRLGCEQKRAEDVYEILRRWAKNQNRKDRDQQIIVLAQSGMKKAEIAQKYGLTRQQVYHVLKRHEERIFLKK